jgi:rhodanese-related sulfurtransferase
MISVVELKQFTDFQDVEASLLENLLKEVSLKQVCSGDTIIGKTQNLALRHYLISGDTELRTSFFDRNIIDHNSNKVSLEALTPSGSQLVANSDCDLICLPSRSVENAIECSQKESAPSQSEGKQDNAEPDEQIDWMSLFLDSPLVHQLSAGTIGRLFSAFTDIELEAGESIFNAGDEPDAFYLMKKGRATIKTQSYSSDNGVSIEIRAGDYFGEEALVGGTVRNAGIFMLSDGCVGRMSREDFYDLLMPEMIQKADQAELQFGSGSDNVLVDARLHLEYRSSGNSNSVNIPVASLRSKLAELDSSKTYYITPEGNERSELATYMLRHAGFNAYLLNYAD